jgi:hypothetical protein
LADDVHGDAPGKPESARFVDDDFGSYDTGFLQTQLRNPFRKVLDQVRRELLDKFEDAAFHPLVVDGVFQRVAGPCRAQVRVKGDVDYHVLFFPALIGIDAHATP